MDNGVIACVLKIGGEYGPEHVEALRDSIFKHNGFIKIVCLTDYAEEIDGVECRGLLNDYPRWWPKLELFDEFKKEPVIYFDLDTVITGPIDDLWRYKLTMLKDVNNLSSFGSGIMAWAGDYSYLYEDFKKNAANYMREYTTTRKWGDQGFIRDFLKETPASFDFGPVLSYKKHCVNGVPPGTKVVYFHGKPRPWQVELKYLD